MKNPQLRKKADSLLFFEFLPIILFFITYKWYGLYSAIYLAIISSILQCLVSWFKYNFIPPLQWLSLLILLLLGGSTLVFHNEWFIKWKPTVVYWLLSGACWLTQRYSPKPLIQRLFEKNLESKMTLPRSSWLMLNRYWAYFFLAVGGINLYVAYSYTTSVWVNFKLFGMLGATLLFSVFQAFHLAYLQSNQKLL